jgi:hypothetical protein
MWMRRGCLVRGVTFFVEIRQKTLNVLLKKRSKLWSEPYPIIGDVDVSGYIMPSSDWNLKFIHNKIR